MKQLEWCGKKAYGALLQLAWHGKGTQKYSNLDIRVTFSLCSRLCVCVPTSALFGHLVAQSPAGMCVSSNTQQKGSSLGLWVCLALYVSDATVRVCANCRSIQNFTDFGIKSSTRMLGSWRRPPDPVNRPHGGGFLTQDPDPGTGSRAGGFASNSVTGNLQCACTGRTA